MGTGNDPDFAGGDLLADRAARREHWAGAFQRIDLESIWRASRGGRFRSSLDDIEPAVLAVLGPFNVHWGRASGQLGIVVLDADCITGELEDFCVGEAKAFARRLRGWHVFGRSASPACVNQLHLLAAEGAAQHSAEAFPKSRLMHVELDGIDLALDDILAETPDTGDEDDIAEP